MASNIAAKYRTQPPLGKLTKAVYQLWEHGGQKSNPQGMFWDGTKYVRGNANTGMQYANGGTLSQIHPFYYQLWENGGLVPQTAYDMSGGSPNLYGDGGKFNPSAEWQRQRTADSTWAANQMRNGNPQYVQEAEKQYTPYINQNAGTPEATQLKDKLEAYRAAHQQYQREQMTKKEYGGPEYGKGGIHIKPENRGKFTAYKKRTGKTTEEALHSPDPHVRRMANFARNAAKWKHEYGGLAKFMDGGDVDETGATMGYEDPNVAQTGVSYPRPNVWPTVANGMMGVAGAGMALGSFINNERNAADVHSRAQQMGLTDNSMMHMNSQGVKGDYNANSGQFRPQHMTPASTGAYYPTVGQYGGATYKNGGVYDLDTKEINRLKKLGYKIEYM